MLLHVAAEVATVHPRGDQIDVLVLLDALDQLGHVMRTQLLISHFLSQG